MQVHLIDGTYELFRHHFAVPSHLDPEGMEVAATRGVVGSMLMMLEGGVTHIGVATDHVVESFRNELYDGYKTSAGMEPELLAQFPVLEDALRALGVEVWAMTDVEADDALASAAAVGAADERVERVIICTPDKDLGQCVVGDRVVQLDRRKDAIRDEAGVIEKFGVPPTSIPDYLALVGDTADGFPGIPGWGAKSTAVVLARYLRIESIPDLAKDWDVDVRGAVKLATNLAAQRDDAALFKVLATLRDDADVGTVDDWRWTDQPTTSTNGVSVSVHRASRAAPTSWLDPGAEPEMSTMGTTSGNDTDAVVVDRSHAQVAVVRMNRPDRRNAMNYALLSGLYDTFAELREDTTCRVIVLTGAGKGFCAGLDLSEGVAMPGPAAAGRAQAGLRVQQYIAGLIPLFRSQPQPIIAAVNGAASGGGLALALGSDIRIAAESARFNVAFIKIGAVGLRHRNQLDPAADDRCVARVRADAHRPVRGCGGSRADRDRHEGGARPRAARCRARRGRPDPGQRSVRHPHDQGGDVVAARDRESPGGHRHGEPHPGALELRG